MKILILEDEQRAALDLQETLQAINPGFEIVGILDSVETAIRRLSSQPQPDIAFFDVQLADGMSFEIFSRVNIHCPVIFCTAFNEGATTFFKKAGVVYVLKPYNRSKIEYAIQRACSPPVFLHSIIS